MRKIKSRWLATLEGLKQDNIIMKNRLSDVLKKEVEHSFVEKAEFFQQLFIDKEQILDLLRHDITALEINLDKSGQDKSNDNLFEHAQLLENELMRVVFEFNQMKILFEHFLLE